MEHHMARTIPPCPHCGAVMRLSYADDSIICRCGFTVDGLALMAAERHADPKSHLMATGHWTPIPKAEPGIRVSDQFSTLDALCWDRRGEQWSVDGLQNAAIAEGAKHGLAHQPGNHRGECLLTERDGKRIEHRRHVMYGVAPRGREVEAAEQMVRAIAVKHGRGRWFSTLDAVHVIADDGLARVADIGGVPHVFLRAAYFHDPTCPLCGKPCDRVEVSGVKINGCSCVGDEWGVSLKGATDLSHPQWPIDPLDVEYDGWKLRDLLEVSAAIAQERPVDDKFPHPLPIPMTACQRAAVSAHWSTELRKRVDAAKDRDRRTVMLEVDE
jgi:hypothetical protein